MGSAVITATVEGRSAAARVTVPTLIQRIEVDHATLGLAVGEQADVVATARAQNGAVLSPAFT